jgi:hypothetical protein
MKIKRKGAYEYNVQWHQDPSSLVVAKAAEAALIHGADIRTFIESHTDNYDFMCRAKVPRSNKLVMRWSEWGTELPLANIIRYYVSRDGGTLHKIAPPTGEPGTWKRATKLTDKYYNAVVAELLQSVGDAVVTHVPVHSAPYYGGTTQVVDESWHVILNGKPVTTDSAGVPHDTRIHTKNRSKHATREMGVCVGWRVTDCSNVKNFDRSTVNYDYYVEEAEKLVKPLLTSKS